MGWDSSTNTLTYPFTKLKLSGRGDLENALKRTATSEIDLFANGTINKWAKYKHQIVANDPMIGAASDGCLTPTQRLNSLYGLTPTRVGRAVYAANYNVAWAYTRRMPYRPFDFIKSKADTEIGYQSETPWQQGAQSAGMLYTIFNGVMGLTGSTVVPGDRIYFSMQCKENAEIDSCLGLLYPADFAGAPQAADDLSTYYVGLAILDAQSNVWIYSDPHISDYLSGINVYCTLDTQLPTSSSLAFGNAIIAPVLTSTRQSSWTTGYTGYIVNLDGAYLPVQIAQPGTHVKYTVTCSINTSTGKTTISVTVVNETGSSVTIVPMVGYLLSNYAEMNEYEVSGTGPDYQGEGANGYIIRRWNLRPPEYKQGDIYSSDWQGGYSSPNSLAARYLNLYSAFYTANGNSNILSPSYPGSPHSVTFSVQVNATSDDFGSYTTAPPYLYILSGEGDEVLSRQFELE